MTPRLARATTSNSSPISNQWKLLKPRSKAGLGRKEVDFGDFPVPVNPDGSEAYEGLIVGVKGKVVYKTKDGKEVTAKIGDLVPKGATLMTDSDSGAILVRSKGRVVKMRDRSSLFPKKPEEKDDESLWQKIRHWWSPEPSRNNAPGEHSGDLGSNPDGTVRTAVITRAAVTATAGPLTLRADRGVVFRTEVGHWIVRATFTLENTSDDLVTVTRANDFALENWNASSQGTFPETATILPGVPMTGDVRWYVEPTEKPPGTRLPPGTKTKVPISVYFSGEKTLPERVVVTVGAEGQIVFRDEVTLAKPS